MEQRASHNRFEQLPNSEVVQQVRKSQAGWTTVDPKTGERDDWYQVMDKGEINSIHWSNENEVESLVTADGQTLDATPPPSAWEYGWIPFFMLLGFFIPWGAVRAIGWVLAGFVHPSG